MNWLSFSVFTVLFPRVGGNHQSTWSKSRALSLLPTESAANRFNCFSTGQCIPELLKGSIFHSISTQQGDLKENLIQSMCLEETKTQGSVIICTVSSILAEFEWSSSFTPTNILLLSHGSMHCSQGNKSQAKRD